MAEPRRKQSVKLVKKAEATGRKADKLTSKIKPPPAPPVPDVCGKGDPLLPGEVVEASVGKGAVPKATFFADELKPIHSVNSQVGFEAFDCSAAQRLLIIARPVIVAATALPADFKLGTLIADPATAFYGPGLDPPGILGTGTLTVTEFSVAAEIFAGRFNFTVRDLASGKTSSVKGSFRITSFD
jgi:hypothetical protein